MGNQYFIYILAGNNKHSLYVGVTNNLKKRIYEHKNKIIRGYTSKYNVDQLVYYQIFENIEQAILREKQLKGGSRQKKIELINEDNSEWNDLYDTL